MIETALKFLLSISLHAGLLVLLILLARLLLGKILGARWQYALWFLLIAKLMLPFGPQSPVSLQNFINLASIRSGGVKGIRGILRIDGLQDRKLQVAGDLSAVKNMVEIAINWPTLILCAWVGGAVLVLFSIAVRYGRMVRQTRQAIPVRDPILLEHFAACQTELGGRRRATLMISGDIESPVLTGIWCPVILLPIGLTDVCSLQNLRFIYLHELVHLKRNDLIVFCAASLLQAMHWFNPLVWYGFHRMRADCELACDAYVVEHIDARESTEYGRMLVELAESMQRCCPVAGALGINEVKSELGRRIMMISKHGNRTWKNAAVGCGIIAVLITINFTSAKDEKQATNTYHGSMRPPVELKNAMESTLSSMASASSSLSNEDNKSTQAFTLTVNPEMGQLIYTFGEKTKQLESIHATTGVKFIYRGIEINADTLDYKLADKKVIANGPGTVMWMTAADHPDAPKVVSEDVTKYTADRLTLDTATGQITLEGNAGMERQGPLGGVEKTNSPGTMTIYLNQPISMQ